MRFALFLFLLTPAYAADPPKVPTVVALPGPLKPVDATAPSKVAVGTFRFVALTGHEGPVTWDFTGAGLKTFDAVGPVIGQHADGPAEPDVYTPPAGPCLAVFGRVPGTVTVAAWGIKDGKPAKVASLVIEVTGARPPPEPGPGPKPEPTPTPKAKQVYLTVIRDVGTITPTQAALLGNTPFWDGLKSSGHEWDFYTPQADEAKAKGYVRLAEKVQQSGPWQPVLVMLDKATGKELKTIPLPADAAGVKAALKEVAGE